MLLLTVLTIVLIAFFFVALFVGLVKILRAADALGDASIGAPTSKLAKIRSGVRAIEQQTAAIGPQAERLNAALDGLHAEIRNLRKVPAAERSEPGATRR